MPYRVESMVSTVEPVTRRAKSGKASAPVARGGQSAPATSSPPSSKPITVGDRLKLCREALKLNKADAARAIKIKAQSWGNIESGETKQPAADILLDMRDVLGISPDYLIRGVGMPLLPKFEELAQEQSLILIFRELRPNVKREAVRALQGLRRTQGGGPSEIDPFQEDAPSGDDD